MQKIFTNMRFIAERRLLKFILKKQSKSKTIKKKNMFSTTAYLYEKK